MENILTTIDLIFKREDILKGIIDSGRKTPYSC